MTMGDSRVTRRRARFGARRRRVATSCIALVLTVLANLNAVASADPPVPVPDPVQDAADDLPVGGAEEDASDQVGDAVDGVTGGSSPAGSAASGQESSAPVSAAGAVGGAVEQATGGQEQSQSGSGAPPSESGSQSTAPSEPTSTTSSESHSGVADVQTGGHSIASVGQTHAGHGPEGQSSPGVSTLALLGHEVIGTQSSSSGAASSQATSGIAAHAVCGATGGDICLALLYGHAQSGPNGSNADGVLLGACVGGDQDTPAAPCTGPVNIEVGQSSSSATGYSSTLVGACFGGQGSPTEPCTGIGATVLSADADADGSRSEVGAALEMGGHQWLTVGHPGALNCTGLLDSCLLLNNGAITQSPDGAAAAGMPGGGPASASAAGSVVQIELGDAGVAEMSGTGATADGDGSSADSTVVSVLGHEVIGAHAAAASGSSESETGYLTESCDASHGRVCLALLFGHASASSGDGTSESSSDSALGSACLGGSQSDPTQPCDGVVGAAALESHSFAGANENNGSATADQWTNGADVCVGGENDFGRCDAVGAEVLHSESHSAVSTSDSGTSDGDSALATVEAGGDDAATIDGDASIPPGCNDDAYLACVTLNQIATDVGTGAATGSAAAAAVGLVGEIDGGYLLGGGVSQSATAAFMTQGDDGVATDPDQPGGDEPAGGEPNEPGEPNAPDGGPGTPEPGGVGLVTPDYSAAGGVQGSGTALANANVAGASGSTAGSLPFTGADPAVPFAAGMILVGTGMLLWAIAGSRLARGRN